MPPRTLNPCPFCGSRHIELIHRERRVVCKTCQAEGPIADLAEQGARYWNQRTAPSITVPNRLSGLAD
jgi:Lar family restriction alleviation protein